MKITAKRFRKFEFEARIFVSFAIVVLVCALCFVAFGNRPSSGALPGLTAGLAPAAAASLAFYLAALFMLAASLLRMWAGSMLTSRRMMRFEVQNDGLVTAGPYRLVRNPIYLADLIAFVGFSLVLPAPGLLMPLLLYLHYQQIIRYEEQALEARQPDQFIAYKKRVNRLLPGIASLKRLPGALKEFNVNRDGFRHNALYLLFIPGFLVSAHTRCLFHAIAIGLPAVALWTYLHIRIGLAFENHLRTKTEG